MTASALAPDAPAFGHPEMTVDRDVAAHLPDWSATLDYLRAPQRLHAANVLASADATGHVVLQPRCGVGGHRAMLVLLRELEPAGPGILSVTIDSYTRLRHFDIAHRQVLDRPDDLNGYPLVAHGWQRGRELVESVGVPLEIRHGSPDARDLFAVALAAGISSFEGGGISYNLPYSKDVPVHQSLRAWQQVDAFCGRLATAGVIVDRELFGTLTGVLVPPSISLAISMLEARAAAAEGVTCISVAYPQGGEIHQDVAALHAIRSLAARYLPPSVAVYPVLHEFMGVFPADPAAADALIMLGGLVGRLGRATKIITKTNQESRGIPDTRANAHGLRTARLGTTPLLDFVRLDDGRVAEEQHWIETETMEIVDAVLAGPDLLTAISDGFATGLLDIPFSASIHARSAVVPKRDVGGAIRYLDPGGLPLSSTSRRRNRAALGSVMSGASDSRMIAEVTADIYHFAARGQK